MAPKVVALVFKSDNFGPSEPCIAVQVTGGTYGVWVAKFDQNGRATGSAYPIGSGARLSQDEAIWGAKSANVGMGGPSANGAFQMGSVTG